MKKIAGLTGILYGAFGVASMMMSTEAFLKYGWALGILIALSGAEMFVPVERKFQGGRSKKVYGGASILFGIMILISSMRNMLIDMIVAYFVGACVVLCGMYLISMGRKEPKKEVKHTHVPKKARKGKQEVMAKKKVPENRVSTIVGTVTIIAGGILTCKPFLKDSSSTILTALSLISLGAAWIVMALNIEENK